MKPIFRSSLIFLALLTVAGVLIAGYHPSTEDDGVYLAAIQHNLNPGLFRVDADFFALQLQATVFDKLIAASVRVTELPVAVVVLAWHLLAIFGILVACYRIAGRCFEHEYARWGGVALVTVLFTLPVAGTALYIVDQNLHPRAIATALALFAVNFVLGRRYVPAAVLVVVAFLFHPIMAAFALSLCVFLAIPWTEIASMRPKTGTAMGMFAIFAMPMGWIFEPTSPAWRAAANTRRYYFLTRWEWYEWLGVIAPIFLLLWFASIARKRGQSVLERLSTSVAVYGVFQLLVALVMTLPPGLERLRPLQPMRYLHLLYLLLILLSGCLIGENFLRQHRWRWIALFVPAALGMFLAQRATYPASPHLELPGMHSSNPWLAAFDWIRENTPEDAYFVLGPDYLHRPGEDSHGFRALALRSVLADNGKDSAVVTQVPRLAARWQREVAAQVALGSGNQGTSQSGIPGGIQGGTPGDWQHVTVADLKRMKAQFGVNWVILERPTTLRLACPYRNDGLEVCRIN